MSSPDEHLPYRGRFAPSPTGPLHFGSLVAAVASYLQARSKGGQWLLRIEDLDPPRELPGAAEDIVQTLLRHGFEPSEPVLRQSERLKLYEAVVDELLERGIAYPCSCTRQEIRAHASPGRMGPIYPGTCRQRTTHSRKARAVRVRTDSSPIKFSDALQGSNTCRLEPEAGDYLIRRGDGLIAYHLAVVVDDHAQGITEVVRGTDLLDSTSAQIHLQHILGLDTPAYMHFPVAVNHRGVKLSKQTGALPISSQKPASNLVSCLQFLRQDPPEGLESQPLQAIWDWAIGQWRPARLASQYDMAAPAHFEQNWRT